jgi:hypothetical protein
MLGKSIGVLLALALASASPAFAQDCVASGPLPEGAIFIGYSRTGESALHSAALLRTTVLEKYDGRNLSVGLRLHEAATKNPTTTRIESVAPYLERMGPDHCEYPAAINAAKSKQWRIWSSKPLTSLRQPSDAERMAFRKLRPDCAHQGDPPPGEEVCVYAELLAISDIDSDGHSEYWHSTPYRWDTGLSISEQLGPSNLELVVAACPGCSD